MTAVSSRADRIDLDGQSEAALIWQRVGASFLALLGWDPALRVVTMPVNDPVLGVGFCAVKDCGKPVASSGLCTGCRVRLTASGQTRDEFVLTAKSRWRAIGAGQCAVPDCERPWKSRNAGLCSAHDHQRAKVSGLSLEEFMRHPGVHPLAGFGPCAVRACYRDAVGPATYCDPHRHLLQRTARRDPGFDLARWEQTAPAPAECLVVSLRALPDLAVAQLLYGVQQKRVRGEPVRDHTLRVLADTLRLAQAGSVSDLGDEGLSNYVRGLRRSVVRDCALVMATPESERSRIRWNLAVFGHGGHLDFGGITQPWLLDGTRRWAFEDLPRRRSKRTANILQSHVKAASELSASLRLQRDDHGADVRALSRADMTAWCNRMSYLVSCGAKTEHARVQEIRAVRHVLAWMRAAGLTRPGQPLHALPEDFTLTRSDVPMLAGQPDARALPPEVMDQLTSQLQLLDGWASPEIRAGVELIIDTGRRPNEIASLRYDCLDRDGDGKPVLVYDNAKANLAGRRLPISEATAAIITRQQARVRSCFPDTPVTGLPLLPGSRQHKLGIRPISGAYLSDRHLRWLERIPPIMVRSVTEAANGRRVSSMIPFDRSKVFLYAYRHTYAQRHADAGVPADVLRQLMDHKSIATTQIYYRITDKRRREAIDKVTGMQFDRHGNRIWQQAKTLLDTEHSRLSIGEVAVPYGVCTEPSNVAAAGQDCPVRFRCVGCGHFRTDVSYLPDLEAYLADLLRSRERLIAMTDVDEWARAEGMPSDQEISRVRQLITRIRQEMSDMHDEDKQQITQAVAVLRAHRQNAIPLGMPRIRQPEPDLAAQTA
jgi:integrase